MNTTHLPAPSASVPHPRTIGAHMTPTPHTIGDEQTLRTAHELMRRHGCRHLPVLHGGRLAGVVSQRDLYFVETLQGVDLDSVPVLEAMSSAVYTAAEEDPLDEVLWAMAGHKLGCTVVVNGKGTVVGIFTVTDAVALLASTLGAAAH